MRRVSFYILFSFLTIKAFSGDSLRKKSGRFYAGVFSSVGMNHRYGYGMRNRPYFDEGRLLYRTGADFKIRISERLFLSPALLWLADVYKRTNTYVPMSSPSPYIIESTIKSSVHSVQVPLRLEYRLLSSELSPFISFGLSKSLAFSAKHIQIDIYDNGNKITKEIYLSPTRLDQNGGIIIAVGADSKWKNFCFQLSPVYEMTIEDLFEYISYRSNAYYHQKFSIAFSGFYKF